MLFTVSVASVVFFLLVALSPIPQLRKQEDDASTRLTSLQADIIKLSLINERATSIKSFIDSRQDYGDKLSTIQGIFTPDISIDSVVLKKQSVFITVSSSSLLSLDKFVNRISTNGLAGYKNITLKSLSKEENKNVFVLSINIET
jgi:hypothetical protein